MNIAVDVGNTTIQIGIFDNNILIQRLTFATDLKRTTDEYVASFNAQIADKKVNISNVEHMLVSNVVPSLSSVLKESLKQVFGVEPMFIQPGLKTGLKISVDNPLEIGADLIADMVGAKEQYGYPLLIVDIGTVTKILLIDNTATFTSCVFLPGLSMSARALGVNAALLPEVDIANPKPLVKVKNTIDAINSGIAFGNMGAIASLCNQYEEELGYKTKRIITGGTAIKLASIIPEGFLLDGDLTLKGIHDILLKQLKTR